MDATQNDTMDPNEAEEGFEEDQIPLQQEDFGLEAEEHFGESEEDDDKSDSITGMSAADKKKHQIEYLQLLKQIDGQNQIVEQLKDQLFKACENPCLTKCQLRDIKKIRACMESENLKLQCMVQRAMQMQNEIPSRCWEEIPIVTTIEDDIFPSIGNYDVMASLGLREKEKTNTQHTCKKKSKKMKRTCPTTHEEDLDSESCVLFKKMAMKDRLIKQLSSKLKALQKEINCHSMQDRPQIQYPCCMGDIEYMKTTVDTLKEDLKCLCEEKQVQIDSKPETKQTKSNDLQKLKDNYAQLLLCIAKKDAQLNELQGRVKGYCGGDSNAKSDNIDQTEIKLLREKVEDMKDEQGEYKCIIKEQSEQLDEYRRKYMDAQQKVEEQKSMLVKIDMNNKRIEGQVEAEVKRIKAKFKEQLNELSQYPKLLENEQIKLLSVTKERDELEGQLRLVCKELKAAKENVTSKIDKPDCSHKLASCEKELILLQNKMDEVLKENTIISEELLKTKLDSDTMRAESAKIITNTKERFEMTRSSMNSRIDSLEKELAQCRANACLSITDREAVIKEMQSQLSTLSYSFDSAQQKIKTLKNHICFLSTD